MYPNRELVLPVPGSTKLQLMLGIAIGAPYQGPGPGFDEHVGLPGTLMFVPWRFHWTFCWVVTMNTSVCVPGWKVVGWPAFWGRPPLLNALLDPIGTDTAVVFGLL